MPTLNSKWTNELDADRKQEYGRMAFSSYINLFFHELRDALGSPVEKIPCDCAASMMASTFTAASKTVASKYWPK